MNSKMTKKISTRSGLFGRRTRVLSYKNKSTLYIASVFLLYIFVEEKREERREKRERERKMSSLRLRCSLSRTLTLLSFLLPLAGVASASFNVTTISFDEGYSPLFGDGNLVRSSDGKNVRLLLDRFTGIKKKSKKRKLDCYIFG